MYALAFRFCLNRSQGLQEVQAWPPSQLSQIVLQPQLLFSVHHATGADADCKMNLKIFELYVGA